MYPKLGALHLFVEVGEMKVHLDRIEMHSPWSTRWEIARITAVNVLSGLENVAFRIRRMRVVVVIMAMQRGAIRRSVVQPDVCRPDIPRTFMSNIVHT
jgi:hypothetical protein